MSVSISIHHHLWFILLSFTIYCYNLSEALASRTSIVTGANGYVAREVVHRLLQQMTADDCILCLVRSSRIASETTYWESTIIRTAASLSTTEGPPPPPPPPQLRVLPYDMKDGGTSLEEALIIGTRQCDETCVYHIASVFGPTEDPISSAQENVKGTEDVVKTVAKFLPYNTRLVLTSSTAAVRGPGQDPVNGKFYTHLDWNTVSQLREDNWGSCYQWSKAESERRAWKLSKSLKVPMSVICPSFVFGPTSSSPSDHTTSPAPPSSSSYSISLVGQWVRGESAVQSRLCVDIRDVAQAHIEAGSRKEAIGERFLVSTEARVPSKDLAEGLQEVCLQTGLGDPKKITYDSEFQGGAIPIGDQEVEAADRLEKYLGIVLRPAKDTVSEMGRALLEIDECQRTST